MATLRQISANRANSKKSTGPRTQAGLARSGQNARTHGLTAIVCPQSDHQFAWNEAVAAANGDQDSVSNFIKAQTKLNRISAWRHKIFEELETVHRSAVHRQLRRIASLDRYERSAYAQLFRAISSWGG